MPLNTLRLNHAPSSHPNDRIVFIKPLKRPTSEQKDYETADLLLRAIAAQCLPVMKSNYLSVTTLEEHEPNPEFIGRNFNNGEIIQLVLRSKGGAWLSIRMIQMVMMHELAHNVQMNHSREFWKVRNKFADEMRDLWAKGYTGDGFWGSGRVLGDLDGVVRQGGGVVSSAELKDLPLCGGTFRSRGRARKRKANGESQKLSWKEKKARRIEKKFGKNGVALGQDEDKRLMLEGLGKGPLGVKPRVAQSKRGRELRAAAALARLENDKIETSKRERLKSEIDPDSEFEDDEFEEVDEDEEDAQDINGNRILDHDGCGMIRVCGDEDQDEVAVKQEMDELEGLDMDQVPHTNSSENTSSLQTIPLTSRADSNDTPKQIDSQSKATEHHQEDDASSTAIATIQSNSPLDSNSITQQTSMTVCPICTIQNVATAITCITCAHVLDRRKDPRAWHCENRLCQESQSKFLNAGDCGVCGICGDRRSKPSM